MDTIVARFHMDWTGFKLDVEVTLPGRGITVLFGPSGSGKTTFLRCLAGLEHPTGGYLSVGGEIWQDSHKWEPPHLRPTGYVFQEASLFSHLSVLGNLRYGQKRAHAESKVNLDHVVELLGIGSLLQRKPDRLSGGERQRVGIARALAVNPRILLMDEPLAALEFSRKKEILPYLERLHDQLEIPVVYVTHSPAEVARLADHVVAMEQGQIVAQGPLSETLARLDSPIRLGEDVGVVIDATIGERDTVWHLARADFSGGALWARDHDVALGRRVRLRVLARDVSLARDEPTHTSILNLLPGYVDSIANDEHAGLALVRVKLGETILLARVTKRSAAALQLSPGQSICVQVKSVALME